MTMAILDAATNLLPTDLGNGDVQLDWQYPANIAAQGVVFDVFGSQDPLDLFQRAYATSIAALTAQLTGFGFSGDWLFTVIARRNDQLSLPAKAARLGISPPPAQVATPSGGAGTLGALAESGMGFPFGITASGGVFAQGGDPLLRSKLLQLVLTVPGERVNLPEYGTRLIDLVFDPNSDVLAAATEFTVNRAIQRYLGDEIRVERVQITADEACLNVDISYVKKADLRSSQVRIALPRPAGALA
jgi:Bacteriophage baseplate protein W